jgi:hypothetical protein
MYCSNNHYFFITKEPTSQLFSDKVIIGSDETTNKEESIKQEPEPQDEQYE